MPAARLVSLTAVVFVLHSCGANAVQPSALTSTDALVRALKDQGAQVSRAGVVPRSAYPFFSLPAQRLVVNGADVQVFEYRNAALAESDAALVSPTGNPIGNTQVSWMDTPNFYRRDRLIVLYVGHVKEVLDSLRAVMGAPFAFGR